MKKSLPILAIIAFVTSCSMIGPKPHTIYERTDLNSKISKVIVFPTTDFSGKVSAGAKSIDPSIIVGWGTVYGADKTIPAGIIIEKVTGAIGNNFYSKFISTLDNVSAIEQVASNPAVKNFASQITEKFGNYQFALAIISGGEAEYNSGNSIYLHLGLFDTKNLTWRLIAKIETKKGAAGNWQVASKAMIANAFDAFKKANDKAE